MVKHFRKEDCIILKMDVEGAEHEILEALLKLHKLGLFDILLYECHKADSERCVRLNQRVRKAAAVAGTTVRMEAVGQQSYVAIDRYSTPERYYPLDPRSA